MSHSLVAGDITGRIIGAFYRVYDRLGYGFLEAVYRRSVAHEVRKAGSEVHEEAPVGVLYDDVLVGHYRADLLVDRRVIVEIKAAASLTPADHRQLLNYLRASEVDVGLLLHFGPKPAFYRMVHDLRPPAASRQSVNADETEHRSGTAGGSVNADETEHRAGTAGESVNADGAGHRTGTPGGSVNADGAGHRTGTPGGSVNADGAGHRTDHT